MGFNPFKAVSRAIQPVTHAIDRALGVPGISNLIFLPVGANTLAEKAVSSVEGALSHKPASTTHAGTFVQEPNFGPPQTTNITYGAPSYGGGGGFDSPFNQYGGSPWDSSMTYFQPSTPQYRTYSAVAPAPADRTWEDLTALLPLFL